MSRFDKAARIALTLALAGAAGACDSFLDVNEDPNNPQDVAMELTLPGIFVAFTLGVLSVAFYNWNTRGTILGGIYGRPGVLLNLGIYLVSALSLLKASPTLPWVRVGALPFAVLAIVYAVILLRGPFDLPAAN